MSTDAEIGFSRPEMNSENLAGKSSPPLFRHLFVVVDKLAQDWAAEYAEEPVRTLNGKLDKKKFRVTAVERLKAAGDKVGDILVFPDFCRLRQPQLTTAQDFDEFIAKVNNAEPLQGETLTMPQVFICAHTSRDARCGFCGPALCEAMDALGKCETRKCSHIGGHVYAGNVIAYRLPGGGPGEQSVGDWFGYVQPSAIPALHEWLLQSKSEDFPTPELQKLWRGRAGVSDKDHVELCSKVCGGCAGDVEDVGAAVCSQVARVVFILGAPGSGKGTQCANLVRDYDLVHLSAGDLLRDERKNPESKDGQLIETYITEGKIVPVAITVKLLWIAMQQHMKLGRCNFLIDGFPRNQDNLDGWNLQLPPTKARVVGVIFLDCAEDIVRARLLERGKTSGRSDDNLESIMKRFKTFVGETMPIVEHFEKQNMSWSLDSSRPIAEVYEDVKRVVEDFVLPKKHSIVVVCFPAEKSKLAKKLGKHLIEEFDCAYVENLDQLDKVRARNVLVQSSDAVKSYHGDLAAVLNLHGNPYEVKFYQEQRGAQVFDVDGGDASAKQMIASAKAQLKSVFLPPVFKQVKLAAPVVEVVKNQEPKSISRTVPVQSEDNATTTNILLAVSALAVVSLVAAYFWRSRD